MYSGGIKVTPGCNGFNNVKVKIFAEPAGGHVITGIKIIYLESSFTIIVVLYVLWIGFNMIYTGQKRENSFT